MNKIFFISLFFILAACQTSQVSDNFELEPFSIQKIGEDSIQEVQFGSKFQNDWPVLQVQKKPGLAVNSQTLSFAVIGATDSASGAGAYPQISKSLLREKVDFILHTGGYVTNGSDWETWWKQFYSPSQDLFKKFPFLFMRGHDEKNLQSDSWIEIGNLIFINFDSSEFVNKENTIKKFREISQRLGPHSKKKEVWLLAHEPIYGFQPSVEDAEPEMIKSDTFSILKESGLFEKVDYILSGHIRNQQIVLTEASLKQFIVGHSGSALQTFGRSIMSSRVLTSTELKSSFGYALFERQGFRKWNIEFKNVSGETKMKCQLKEQKLICD